VEILAHEGRTLADSRADLDSYRREELTMMFGDGVHSIAKGYPG
jgi:hypothetical protein